MRAFRPTGITGLRRGWRYRSIARLASASGSKRRALWGVPATRCDSCATPLGRAMAVGGGGPRSGFWLQHSRNGTNEQVALLGDLASTPAGRPGMSLGPLNAPNTLNPLFAQVRTADDAVLDPHGLLLDRDHTENRRTHFPWLTQDPRPSTQTEWEAWMKAALDHQNS